MDVAGRWDHLSGRPGLSWGLGSRGGGLLGQGGGDIREQKEEPKASSRCGDLGLRDRPWPGLRAPGVHHPPPSSQGRPG